MGRHSIGLPGAVHSEKLPIIEHSRDRALHWITREGREGEKAVHSGKGDGACEQLRNRDRPALGPSETPKDRTGFRGNGRHTREGCTEGKDGAGPGRTLAWGGGIPGGGHSPSGDVG